MSQVVQDSACQFVDQLQMQLQCTVMERDQKAAWSMAPVRVLTHVAIHSELDTEERVACALGGHA